MINPFGLTWFVFTNHRYSSTAKMLFFAYVLVNLALFISIIGLILLASGEGSSDPGISQQERNEAYAGFFWMLLITVPVILHYRRVVDAKYTAFYKIGKKQR